MQQPNNNNNPNNNPNPFFTTTTNNPLTPSKPSQITTKRQQFKAQIRRDYLDNLFASKRKQLIQLQINQQQKQRMLQSIQQLLQLFIHSKTYAQGQSIISKISQQLNKPNAQYQLAINKFSRQLLKCFILYPRYKQSIQILYKIVSYCYQQTFDIDDKGFIMLYGDNVYQVKLQNKELTEYQQAIVVLMAIIDDQIQSLGNRYSHQHQLLQLQQKSQQQPSIESIQRHNNKIQKRVRIYLCCLKQLVVKLNTFIMRYQFVQKYLIKWSYLLLIKYKFEHTSILYYLLIITRFMVPFRTWVTGNSDNGNNNNSQLNIHKQSTTTTINHYNNNNNHYNNNKNNHNNTNQNLQLIYDQIMSQLFTQCLPTTIDMFKDKLPYLSMVIIKQIFTYTQIKIHKIVQYLQPLTHLLKIVLNHRRYFKHNAVNNMFELLAIIINRFNQQMLNQDTNEETKTMIENVNLVKVLTDMEFIATFDIYFMMENQSICLPIYQIICQLIDYCLIFNIELSTLLYQKTIFPHICHKLDSNNHKILEINLKSIELICEYAARQNRRQFFVKMVDYGVDQRLEHLVYHMNEWVAEKAIRLQQLYFTQEQVYSYTELENQLQRYDYQEQEWE